MIHYLPLERIETRYSAHLDDSILDYLHEQGLEYQRYYPNTSGRAEAPPQHGHFLNATGTIEFKTKQISELAEAWDEGEVQDGDLVFTSDLWHPGIEAVGYMAHFTRRDVKLRGLLWAGTFTEYDLIQPTAVWGSPYETAVLNLAEKAFLGSHDMRQTVLDSLVVDHENLIVSGFPLDKRLDDIEISNTRGRVVVWNGRITREKQPELVPTLASGLDGVGRVENVTALKLPKLDYYRRLAKSKVVVSFALEETFGFAVQEAVKLGCVPVLPNRLCYREQFPPEYLYDNFSECISLCKRALRDELPVPPLPVYDPLPAWFEGC